LKVRVLPEGAKDYLAEANAMDQELYDVTIVGGGPAGLFSAFYSGLREMKTKIIEAQPELGGKLHVYPEKLIWDIGGLPPVTGAQLIRQLVRQAMTFEPTVVLNEKVTAIRKTEAGHFALETASGRTHLSKSVILAIGGGIIKPQKLGIEGAEKYEKTNLHYTVQELKRFKGKKVLISGGGHTAVDWANELVPVAREVHVVYRGGEFNAHEAQVSQLLRSPAKCLFYTEIRRLIADAQDQTILKVELINNQSGETWAVDADEVVISHGYDRDTSLLENSALYLEMANEYCLKSTSCGETSEPGIFAAGDIIHYEGKVHLIAGTFQDAINAVNKAKQFIDPKAKGYAIASSHNEVFQTRNREIIASQL